MLLTPLSAASSSTRCSGGTAKLQLSSSASRHSHLSTTRCSVPSCSHLAGAGQGRGGAAASAAALASRTHAALLPERAAVLAGRQPPSGPRPLHSGAASCPPT
jgi:hypothetical protein